MPGIGKTVDDIRPPRPVPGMEKALPDFSERLAKRTGANARLVDAKFTRTISVEEEAMAA